MLEIIGIIIGIVLCGVMTVILYIMIMLDDGGGIFAELDDWDEPMCRNGTEGDIAGMIGDDENDEE